MRTVDIILICYNQEQYIRQAVESILMQQVSADILVRILVADDHSTDNTLVVIREIRNKKRDENEMFEWVFLPEEPNLGISLNYKRCFEAAKADYVVILEGDDYWSTANHLQQHVDFLAAHPECSMSMNRITNRWGDNPDLEEARWYGDNRPYHPVTLKDQIEWGNQLGNLSACCFRTSCLKNIPEKAYSVHMDDFLLGILMAEQGNIGLLRETTSVYRGNPNSLWASRSEWSKLKRNLEFARLYEGLQEGRYADMWHVYRRRLIREYRMHVIHSLKLSIQKVLAVFVFAFFIVPLVPAVNVVFRYDDVTLQNEPIDWRLIRTFAEKKVPLSLAVLACDDEETPLQNRDSDLIAYINAHDIEMCVHGLVHSRNEFESLDSVETYRRLDKACQIIQPYYKRPLRTFMPPYNTINPYLHDAMLEHGITCLCSHIYNDPIGDGIEYYPETLDALARRVGVLRAARTMIFEQAGTDALVVIMMHAYDFRNRLDWYRLCSLLDDCLADSRVCLYTCSGLEDASIHYNTELYLQMQKQLYTRYSRLHFWDKIHMRLHWLEEWLYDFWRWLKHLF